VIQDLIHQLTDDMRSQDCALHYSASRGKKKKIDEVDSDDKAHISNVIRDGDEFQHERSVAYF